MPDSVLFTEPGVEVYDSSFNELIGDYYAIASKANGIVQVAIPRSLLGNPSSIGFNVLLFVGDGRGGAVDPGSPKIVDLISSSSTDEELGDSSVDEATALDLSQVPFFSDRGAICLVAVFLALSISHIFRRRA